MKRTLPETERSRTEPVAAEAAPPAEQFSETPFYIPATGPATRPRRTLKHGDTFAVLDSHGDIGATRGGPDGLYHQDTRYLSRLELVFNGMQPLLLGSNIRDDNAALTVDLTNPDIYFEKRIVLQKDTLHLLRTIFLWRDTLYQRVAIRNHGDRPVSFQLTFTFGNEFTDLFEVRGLRRIRRGSVSAAVKDVQGVNLDYDGVDGRHRRTALTFDPPPAQLTESAASYKLELGAGELMSMFVVARCHERGEEPVLGFFPAMLAARRERRITARGTATVTTSNALFNEMLCRSTADLHMLITETPEGPYPYAGIPWYSTTFGRDAVLTALSMLWFDPRVARGVLKRLAAFQAKEYDRLADAEPGKILHEMRGGEMAALREVPFGLYYGSVDSTPLFVLLAGLYFERTGDEATLRELWPAVEAALGWIDGPADRDQDGFIEYQRSNEDGLANQGWKDSGDAIFHADGRLAEGPIALAEVQGYVYAAKRLAARCARHLGETTRSRTLDREATKLAEHFEKAFWCEAIETYALALDGDKRPCEVRTSNAGQLLFTGMVRPDRAHKVAQGLLHPRFFSGWGIRTVAQGEARFNPMSYHNGSIWPHDNALIGLGFARYNFKPLLDHVFKGMFDAAVYMDLRRLPELFCGFRRAPGQGPTLYPVACSPQAWASVSPFLLLQACLGLEFDPVQDEIRLCGARLPPFLDEVFIRNLSLGTSTVDLLLRRHQDDVSLQLERRQGSVRVALVPDQGVRP